MANILSALVYTIVDMAGTPRTEAWLTVEFNEGVQNKGGIAVDFSPYYKLIHYIQIGQISGESIRASVIPSSGPAAASGGAVYLQPTVGDYSTPVSLRFVVLIDNINSGMGRDIVVSAGKEAISGIRFMAHLIGY